MRFFFAQRATNILLVLSAGVGVAQAVEVWDTPALIRRQEAPVSASRREVLDLDLSLRPVSSPTDLLRSAPGLVIGQHAGGGKADQLFLRGFDADHGTDVSVTVSGIPVNLVTHAHGQGYADMHFVIPETVQRVEVLKGAFQPDQGDFAVAGSVNLELYQNLPENFVKVGGGSFNTARAVAGVKTRVPGMPGYVAFEGYRSDGPFDNEQNARRYNLLWTGHHEYKALGHLSLLASSFGSDWHASGQIPLREVEAGRLSRWGSTDPTEGGRSQRHNLSAAWEKDLSEQQRLSAQLYGFRYQMQLFSNFTFFLNNPVEGDGIEQLDDRKTWGSDLAYRYRGGLENGDWVTTLGFQSRSDDATVQLWNQQARNRSTAVDLSDVIEHRIGVYLKEEIPLTDKIRLIPGLRYDRFAFEADGAEGTDGILSPKANLQYSPFERTSFFANVGSGFHSNDARAAAVNPDIGVVRAKELEFGVRHQTSGAAYLGGVSLWAIDLESELVYVGDDGTTEPKGRSRRAGVETDHKVRLLPWLWVDGDLALSQAKFRNTGEAVPLAPETFASAGFSALHPSGFYGSLRARHLGKRWGIEDRSVRLQGYTLCDTLVGYKKGPWSLELSLFNIANSEWREAQFVFPSQLQSEAAPVDDIHFTPGSPRQWLLMAKYSF